MKTEDIIKALVELTERPWCEWNRGKAITPQALRSLLEPFKISSTQHQESGDRGRGYERAHFADVWDRYLPGAVSVHPCATQQSRGFPPNQDPCTGTGPARMPTGVESGHSAGPARMHGSGRPEADDGEGAWL
jgi:hypothetical protein